MSCTYDCSGNLICTGIPLNNGLNCSQAAPQAAYTEQQNTTYGFWNASGQFKFDPALDISNQYVSPATLQSYPLPPGAYASQVIKNQGDKALFHSTNAQMTQFQRSFDGTGTPANSRNWLANNQPTFKSHQDLMRYIQAQYTQPLPGTNQGQTLYTVNSLAPPYPTYT